MRDPKTASLPAARDFLKMVRRELGRREGREEIKQEELAALLDVEVSQVGRWEGTSGAAPSYPYVCRLFILLGAVGKDLRPTAGDHVQSPPMSTIENAILSKLRMLPEDKQLEIAQQLAVEVHKHEEALRSQQPAALKKG